MTQIYPQSDDFTETATPYDGYHVGWARLVPWTSDAGSGDSIVTAVGDLGSGYFGSARRASTFNASGTASALSCFAWGRSYQANVEARLGLIWQPSPTLGPVGFRYAMVGVRIAGQSINDATPGSERLDTGNGYWLVLRSTASATTAKWMLLRVNAGTVTKLTETALFDISTLNLQTGLLISLKATTVSGNVVLDAQRETIGKLGLETPVETLGFTAQIFGGTITDSSGSKLTAAGRCGFGISKPPSGGAALATGMQIKELDTDTVVLRDEWLRANLNVGAAVGPDANSVSGRNLLPYFGGGIGGYTGVSTRLARDASNNRARNVSGSTAWDCPMAVAASHPAIQRRYGRVTFSTSSGQTDRWKIELRGSSLHGISGPFGGGSCYRADIICADGTAFSVELAVMSGATRTLLASKTITGVATGTAIKFDLDIQNTGGLTPMLGDPNLIVRVNDSVVSGWTSAGVVGVDILANGTVVDRRTAAIRAGSEQAHRYARTAGSAGTFLLDDWTDAAVLPADPIEDVTTFPISGETDGVTGTLTVPVSFRVDQERRDPSVLHRYCSGHAQGVALQTRARRKWTGVRSDAATATEDADLLAFYNAHSGVAIPFYWQTDDGDTAIVHFTNEDLAQRMAKLNTYAFLFQLEELFA